MASIDVAFFLTPLNLVYETLKLLVRDNVPSSYFFFLSFKRLYIIVKEVLVTVGPKGLHHVQMKCCCNAAMWFSDFFFFNNKVTFSSCKNTKLKIPYIVHCFV